MSKLTSPNFPNFSPGFTFAKFGTRSFESCWAWAPTLEQHLDFLSLVRVSRCNLTKTALYVPRCLACLQGGPDAPLTREIVEECISLLCKTGDGLAHAYVRLDVKERLVSVARQVKKLSSSKAKQQFFDHIAQPTLCNLTCAQRQASDLCASTDQLS